MLVKKFGGKVPSKLDDLLSLPGVGPKMSHLLLQHRFNKTEGISVDTHVHRVVNRLGWVNKTTKNPEETRIALEEWVPKVLWKELNPMLVGFGQTICTPRNPKCYKCPARHFCKYKFKNLDPVLVEKYKHLNQLSNLSKAAIKHDS